MSNTSYIFGDLTYHTKDQQANRQELIVGNVQQSFSFLGSSSDFALDFCNVADTPQKRILAYFDLISQNLLTASNQSYLKYEPDNLTKELRGQVEHTMQAAPYLIDGLETYKNSKSNKKRDVDFIAKMRKKVLGVYGSAFYTRPKQQKLSYTLDPAAYVVPEMLNISAFRDLKGTTSLNSSKVISAHDIINMLNLFMFELEHIKFFDCKLKYCENKFGGGLFLAYQILKKADTYYSKPKKHRYRSVVAMISPYTTKKTDPGQYETYHFTTTNCSLPKTNFAGLSQPLDRFMLDQKRFPFIKTYNVQSDTPTFDILDETGSNGQFRYFKEVKSNDFKLSDAVDLEMFGISPKTLIKKERVLAAIDYIFKEWIENIKVLDVTYYVCHCNCHGDVIKEISLNSAYIYGSNHINMSSIQSVTRGEITGGEIAIGTSADIDSYVKNFEIDGVTSPMTLQMLVDYRSDSIKTAISLLKQSKPFLTNSSMITAVDQVLNFQPYNDEQIQNVFISREIVSGYHKTAHGTDLPMQDAYVEFSDMYSHSFEGEDDTGIYFPGITYLNKHQNVKILDQLVPQNVVPFLPSNVLMTRIRYFFFGTQASADGMSEDASGMLIPASYHDDTYLSDNKYVLKYRTFADALGYSSEYKDTIHVYVYPVVVFVQK